MSTTATPHMGRKISRIRELRGMKQEALAIELGISQQSVSHLEQSETVEAEKLEQVAKVLGVTPQAIKNYSDEAIVNYFNTFNEKVSNSNFGHHNTCTFNPLDKLLEATEENKKLYERLLAAEQEKITYLEKLLAQK